MRSIQQDLPDFYIFELGNRALHRTNVFLSRKKQ